MVFIRKQDNKITEYCKRLPSPIDEWEEISEESQDLQDYLSQTGDYAIITNNDLEQWELDRVKAYGSIGSQLDMMYWDETNSTTVWKDHIASVKTQYPKEGGE